ncbi:hypothetical protein Rhal01_01285 [Rubritalea halochordaticola]|uniref:Redoxin domain-containing protein n=1 Tax=Rubritalea halochordaticola TaxID=714537 RepID=A0ABP9UXA9_9BACT
MNLQFLKQAALGLFMATSALSTLSAKETNLPDHKITEWSLGKTVSGEERSLDKLKGKVVVIENWGVG